MGNIFDHRSACLSRDRRHRRHQAEPDRPHHPVCQVLGRPRSRGSPGVALGAHKLRCSGSRRVARGHRRRTCIAAITSQGAASLRWIYRPGHRRRFGVPLRAVQLIRLRPARSAAVPQPTVDSARNFPQLPCVRDAFSITALTLTFDYRWVVEQSRPPVGNRRETRDLGSRCGVDSAPISVGSAGQARIRTELDAAFFTSSQSTATTSTTSWTRSTIKRDPGHVGEFRTKPPGPGAYDQMAHWTVPRPIPTYVARFTHVDNLARYRHRWSRV